MRDGEKIGRSNSQPCAAKMAAFPVSGGVPMLTPRRASSRLVKLSLERERGSLGTDLAELDGEDA